MKALLVTLTLFLLAAPAARAALMLNASGPRQNFLYEPDSKALVSSVMVVLRTGSLSDPTGKEGLANVAFHALMRGTKTRNKAQFFAAVERLGGSISVDTGAERTILRLDTLSDNLREGLGLLADAMLHPQLSDGEIQSLIQEELAKRNLELSNNRAIMQRVFEQGLFHGTHLAFPPSGTTNGLKSITPDDVRNFLKTQIQSGNAVVAVTSNLPEKQILDWMDEAFVEFPEGKAPMQAEPKLQEPQGRSLYVVDRPGSSTTQVAIGQLGVKADRPDKYALDTAQFILGGDMSSRLFQILRGQHGWTYGAYSGYDMLDIPRRYGGAFMIYTFPQAEHTEQTVLKALDIYKNFLAKGVTQKELGFARQSLVNSYPFQFATSSSRLNGKLYHFLDGAPIWTVPQYTKLMSGLTRAKVLQAIQKAQNAKNLVIVLVGDPARTAALAKSIPDLKQYRKVTDPMRPFIVSGKL
jgi:zinc protease